MKKLILLFCTFFVFGLSTVYGAEIQLGTAGGDAVINLHRIGDAFTSSGNTCSGVCEDMYVENGGYTIRQGGATINSNGQVYQNPTLWDGTGIPATYTGNRMVKIETETFVYILTKPYNISSANTSAIYREQFVYIYDKQDDKFYYQKFTTGGTTKHELSPKFFFLGGQLHWLMYGDSQWYKFETNPEFTRGIKTVTLGVTTNLQAIQYNDISNPSISWHNNFTASDNGSVLYYAVGTSIAAYTFTYDPDLGYLRNDSSVAMPYNPVGVSYDDDNIVGANYQMYNIILKDSKIYISMLWSSVLWRTGTTRTTSNLKLGTFEYNPNGQTWAYFDDLFLYHYNHYNGHGWSTNRQKMIDENLKYTPFSLVKNGFWSVSSNAYKKAYMKTNDYLYTNDAIFFDNTESTGSGTVEGGTYGTGTGTLNTGTGSTGGTGGDTNYLGIEGGITFAPDFNGESTDTGTGNFLDGTGSIFTFNIGTVKINSGGLDGTCTMFIDGVFQYTNEFSNSAFVSQLQNGSIIDMGERWNLSFFGVNVIGWVYDVAKAGLGIPQKVLGFIMNRFYSVFNDYIGVLSIPERGQYYCFFGESFLIGEPIQEYYSYSRGETVNINGLNNIEIFYIFLITMFLIILVFKF